MGQTFVFANVDQGNHVSGTPAPIQDATHTKVLFQQAMHDPDGLYNFTDQLWRLPSGILVPTLVRITAQIAWWPQDGAAPGYGKIWAHIHKDGDPSVEINLGDGRSEGPRSGATIGIHFAAGILFEPGWNLHLASQFFNGNMPGTSTPTLHKIQSGASDINGTPQRTYLMVEF